jgi:RNA recognition motif-containing protein
MGMNLYVGNLAYDVSDVELKDAFSSFGTILTTKIIIDKHTNQSRGFGFVEFAEREAGEAAIAGMQGKPIHNRNITVNEARPPEPRQPGNDNNNRRSNYGDNRNSYRGNNSNSGNSERRGFGGGNRERGPRNNDSPLYQPSVERQYD